MRVFFLGPGFYEGDRDKRALHDRYKLAELIENREVLVMELVDAPQKDLMDKFTQLMDQADEVLVWLPSNGRLTTVFAELLLLRQKKREWAGRPVWILAAAGILDCTSQEFRVLHRDGQMAYLLDLPKHYDVHTFEYDTQGELETLVRLYDAGSLEDA